MKKISIRGLHISNTTMREALDFARKHLGGDKQITVFTPNAEIAEMCEENHELKSLINRADLILPDGAGVVMASKILGTPLKGKVAGIDFAQALLTYPEAYCAKTFLLGGKPGIAEQAKIHLEEVKRVNNFIIGTHHGYFEKTGAENDAVIQKINDSRAEILFVCFGAPAQEKWIMENKDKLPCVRLIAGLGGSLDVWGGEVKRAPKFFIKLNLEWLYRLIKEPRRIGRMMKIPKYLLGTVRERLRGNKLGTQPEE